MSPNEPKNRARTPHLVIAPVFSHYGFKSWTLIFLPEEIIGVPHSPWPIILKTGFFAAVLMRARAYAVDWKQGARAREEWSTIESTKLPKNAWRIPLSSVKRIELRRQLLSASELRIQQTGQPEFLFGIYDPSELGHCAEKLRRAYPRIYFEQ
ncbi:hypothetical protein [Archangium lansingense]|uniref:PH (Pleckstrin Homology) domain-containing protein n=1 Tax=Archangium lansingense TaxID=2995310 RepID=A0ABT3ZY46_9BACT|nr:hypothetical protein [Archangium lansinium]MCY1074326.1 hypothetical protein [Archangium lansinium]